MTRSTKHPDRPGKPQAIPPERRRRERPVPLDRRKTDQDIAERMASGVSVKKRGPKKNGDT